MPSLPKRNGSPNRYDRQNCNLPLLRAGGRHQKYITKSNIICYKGSVFSPGENSPEIEKAEKNGEGNVCSGQESQPEIEKAEKYEEGNVCSEQESQQLMYSCNNYDCFGVSAYCWRSAWDAAASRAMLYSIALNPLLSHGMGIPETLRNNRITEKSN